MPIKRGEIYLFIGFDAEKFSPKRFGYFGALVILFYDG